MRFAPAAWDHRSIHLELRGAGGWLGSRNGARLPVNEGFFGGVRARRFTDLPDWDVRSAPVIRSLGSNRFLPLITSPAAGSQRFYSVNMTAAVTGYRRSLLPREIRELPDFASRIQSARGTVTGSLESYHESRDPALREADRPVEQLDAVFDSLTEKTEQLTVPDALSGAKDECLEAIDRSQGASVKAREQRTYAALVQKTLGGFPRLLAACGEDLPKVNEPLLPNLAKVKAAMDLINDILEHRVNRELNKKRVKEDERLANRALDVFVREINLVSVDPLVIFDRAWIRVGQARASNTLFRNASGGGLRLTLASTVSFETGYAFTLNRGRGEPRGSFFFGLRLFDLIR